MAFAVGPIALAGMRAHTRGNEAGVASAQRQQWQAQAGALTQAELTQALALAALTPATTASMQAALTAWVSDTLADRWRSSLRAGARLVDSSFELLTPSTIDLWVKDRTLPFLTNQSDAQTKALNLAIRSMIGTATPESTMRNVLRETVGLTQRQSRSLQAHIASLRADGVSEAQITQSAQRFSNRARSVRARMIARTELAAAYNGGTNAAIVSGVQQGLFESVEKEWRAQTGADCKICAPVDGDKVPLGESFANGQTMPPAHPGCRCVLLYQVD